MYRAAARPRRSGAALDRRLAEALERFCVFRLDRAGAELRERAERALRSAPVDLNGLAALLVLAECNVGLSQTALGDRIGLGRRSVSEAAGGLERRGLIVREPSLSDGRALRIEITQDGRAVAARHELTLRTVDVSFLEPLGEQERDHLREMLRRLEPGPYVIGNLRRARVKAPSDFGDDPW